MQSKSIHVLQESIRHSQLHYCFVAIEAKLYLLNRREHRVTFVLINAHHPVSMAEEEKQSEAPAAEATESNDTGFANRRLHNYPLIRVSIVAD